MPSARRRNLATAKQPAGVGREREDDDMQVAWQYGAPGVGKSTAAWQLYSDLTDSRVSCAYVDIDQLGMCYPAPLHDPDTWS